jgi:hypothetical protein
MRLSSRVCGRQSSIAPSACSSIQLSFGDLFGPGVESLWDGHLAKLYMVAVDTPCGGLNGRVIIDAIHLNRSNGSVVYPNNIRAIGCHLLRVALIGQFVGLPGA